MTSTSKPDWTRVWSIMGAPGGSRRWPRGRSIVRPAEHPVHGPNGPLRRSGEGEDHVAQDRRAVPVTSGDRGRAEDPAVLEPAADPDRLARVDHAGELRGEAAHPGRVAAGQRRGEL